MFINTLSRRLIFNVLFIFILIILHILIFYQIYTSDNIIISFAVHPFNICEKYPDTWLKLKLGYIVISFISSLICTNHIYSFFFTKKKIFSNSSVNSDDLSLFIAKSDIGESIILPEKSLYQNILITGTIGSGKTSSAMYPFTKQLIKYKYNNQIQKLGMLILDVKGNYYSQVRKYVKHYKREDDLIIIELRWKY